MKIDIEWKDKNNKLHFKTLTKKAGVAYIHYLIEDGATNIHITRVDNA